MCECREERARSFEAHGKRGVLYELGCGGRGKPRPNNEVFGLVGGGCCVGVWEFLVFADDGD